MLHIDPFNAADLRRLDGVRDEHCVSVYLKTHRVSRDAARDRILYGNLARTALDQLAQAGGEPQRLAATAARLESITDNLALWNHMADGLAVFATPDMLELYRLPRAVAPQVQVADRFLLKPLVPLLAFPHTAYLLHIARGGSRFYEVTEGDMHELSVAGMPTSLDAFLAARAGSADEVRMRQPEDRKVRQRQYAQAMAAALKPMLYEQSTPLVLAGDEAMVADYRAVDGYRHTCREAIGGNQEHSPRDTLAAAVRAIVARRFDTEVRELLDRVEALRPAGLSSTDMNEIARAARQGRVDTILVDIAQDHQGRLDGAEAPVPPPVPASAETYDVLDELVGLTLRQSGSVIPVGPATLPRGVAAAAIFRYAA